VEIGFIVLFSVKKYSFNSLIIVLFVWAGLAYKS